MARPGADRCPCFPSVLVPVLEFHWNECFTAAGSCIRLVDMTLSARNQLKGTVEEIQLGGVMAHVVVCVGENLIESVITRRSAEEMALKKGDLVKVVIKSTEVMLQKD